MIRRSARLADRLSALRSSPFRFLEANDLLGLVIGRADLVEHDAFCAALVWAAAAPSATKSSSEFSSRPAARA